MPDLSKLSDDELDALIEAKKPKNNLDSLSDDELDALIEKKAKEEESFLDVFDVVGAPTRAAISKGIEEGPIAGLKAGYEQFGKSPVLAPTGAQIAEQLGAEQRPGELDVADVAGFGIDVLADPLSFLPVGAVAKGLGKGAQAAGKGLSKLDDVAGGAAKAAKSFVGITDVSDDFGRLAKTAQKAGIDPQKLSAQTKFGEVSRVARAERALGERPNIIGEMVRKNHEEVVGKIDDAFTTKIEDLSGVAKTADKADEQQRLGGLIKELKLRRFKEANNAEAQLFGDFAKSNADLIVSPKAGQNLKRQVQAIKETANEAMEIGVDPLIERGGQKLQKIADDLVIEDASFENLLKQRTRLGNVIFEQKAFDKAPEIKRQATQMYFNINEALFKTIEESNPLLAKQIKKTNKKVSEFLTEKAPLAKAAKDKADEKVFREFLVNTDTKKLKAIKAAASPEEVKQMRGAMMNELISEGANGINAQTTLNNIRKKRSQLKEVFTNEEIQFFEDLLELKQKQGIPRISTSGTGESNILNRGIIERVIDGTIDPILYKGFNVLNRSKSKVDDVLKGVKKSDSVKAGMSKSSKMSDIQKLLSASNAAKGIKGGLVAGKAGASVSRKERSQTQKEASRVVPLEKAQETFVRGR